MHAASVLVPLFMVPAVLSFIYTCVAFARVATLRLPQDGRGEKLPTITILKALSGSEPELAENLATFCEQDYPSYNVVFAVREAADPATIIARRVIQSHPNCNAEIVSGGGPPLLNPKIENLCAAIPKISGEIVVIADSDMQVKPSYLRRIAAAFEDQTVGAATAIFGARALPAFVAHLGAMLVNEQFVPSALVAISMQRLAFTLGATMAVRRRVLDEIGGLAALGTTIADDYMLGHLTAGRGYRVALAGTIPLTLVSESNLRALLVREVRWARTVRSVRPLGYAGSIFTYSLFFAVANLVVAAIFNSLVLPAGGLLLATFVIRVALHIRARRALGVPGTARPWLVPVREGLSVLVWIAGLFGASARWRKHRVRTGRESS
jgi:ceramide glucosyltransferase